MPQPLPKQADSRSKYSTVDKAADISIRNGSELVLACAQVLHTNGQSTHETVQAAERLGSELGLRVMVIPRWEALELRAQDSIDTQISFKPGSPTSVNMDRVASAVTTIEDPDAGRLAIDAALENIKVIAHAPPASTWLFTLAAAAGAAAMAAIFGVRHLKAEVLIVLSAAAGAVLRRTLARYSANTLLQPFCAAMLAGMIGALAVRYNLSSSLRLVAVCPCMILVPGPHVLNGAMDLIAARINLGASRLVYAGLIILAISVGLLLGMGLLSVGLPVGEPGRVVSFWLDVIAAGVAVAAFSVFFSIPLRMLGWPVAIGMLAHALRWGALKAGAGIATGALVACLSVGLILTPVARRWRMPFAAIGFASVVSMMPGLFLFRTASGLVQLTNNSNANFDLLRATIADAMSAITVILAMSFGVVAPKIIIDRFGGSATPRDRDSPVSLISAPSCALPATAMQCSGSCAGKAPFATSRTLNHVSTTVVNRTRELRQDEGLDAIFRDLSGVVFC
jgi:uncharacterized membrane protein YjjP (DUF1212 family)